MLQQTEAAVISPCLHLNVQELPSLVENPFEQYTHGTMAKYEAFDGSRIGQG